MFEQCNYLYPAFIYQMLLSKSRSDPNQKSSEKSDQIYKIALQSLKKGKGVHAKLKTQNPSPLQGFIVVQANMNLFMQNNGDLKKKVYAHLGTIQILRKHLLTVHREWVGGFRKPPKTFLHNI